MFNVKKKEKQFELIKLLYALSIHQAACKSVLFI